MGADLRIATMVGRESLLVIDDALVCLDHESGKDRMRKILFDRVESIVVWRTLPWGRMLLWGLFLGLLSLPLFFIPEAGVIVGTVVLLILVAVETAYYVCGKTFIRISSVGAVKEFVVITWPGKGERAVNKMVRNIEATQQAAAVRVESIQQELMAADRQRLEQLSGPSQEATPTG